MPRFEESSKEEDLLSALSEPLRRQILRRMRGVEKISSRELSNDLGRPVGDIAYHAQILVSVGAITLVGTMPVRGTLKHFYRSAVTQPWANEIIDLEPPVAGSAAKQ